MTELPRLLSGRYEVGELIGRGGMAEVHVGHDTRLGRKVAIKMLRSDLARDSSFLTRFRREAQSSAKLNHPAIVAVYDSGDDHSTVESGGASVTIPFIVMEYVEGQTLREVLHERGPLDPAEAARITEGVLDALAYSHRMGIVHRDIKPANVMITSAGVPKVMDFGIARAIADANATMTQTQAVIGTAQYLSPEQAQGQPVDARSDLYSTGCMLYELLTGRPPFQGDSPVAIAYQHVGEQPTPPSTYNAEVIPAYDAVVLHALVKDREGRYQSAGDFRADLQSARLGMPVSPAAAGTGAAVASGAPTERLGRPVEPTEIYTAGGAVGGVGAATVATGRRASNGTAEIPLVVTDEDPRQRRGATWVLLSIAILAALGLLAYGAKTYFDNQAAIKAQRTVPAVVNKLRDAATREIRARELKPVVKTDSSDNVDKGYVISQDPEAGTRLAMGSDVTITVSTGPSSIAVPPLAGHTVDEARTILDDAGLSLGQQEKVDDTDVAKGNIIESDPAEGEKLAPGTPVKVKVSSGKVTVPDVSGKDQNDASRLLGDAGLVAQFRTVETADAKPGTVARQLPKAGARIARGSAVTVYIAVKPQAPPSSASSTPTPTDTSSTPTPPPTP